MPYALHTLALTPSALTDYGERRGDLSIIDPKQTERQCMRTVEEKREARRVAQIKYRATKKGKTAVKKYNSSVSHKEAVKKYVASDKWKELCSSVRFKKANKQVKHMYYRRNKRWFDQCTYLRRELKMPFTIDEFRRRAGGERIPSRPITASTKQSRAPKVIKTNILRAKKGLSPIVTMVEYNSKATKGTLYIS